MSGVQCIGHGKRPLHRMNASRKGWEGHLPPRRRWQLPPTKPGRCAPYLPYRGLSYWAVRGGRAWRPPLAQPRLLPACSRDRCTRSRRPGRGAAPSGPASRYSGPSFPPPFFEHSWWRPRLDDLPRRPTSRLGRKVPGSDEANPSGSAGRQSQVGGKFAQLQAGSSCRPRTSR